MRVNIKLQDNVFGQAESSARRKPVHLFLISETLTSREIVTERSRAHYRSTIVLGPNTGESRADIANWLWRKRGEWPGTEEEAVATALNAFQENRFFLFWNGQHVTDIDQRLLILPENDARFIPLFPLKGG